MTAIPETEVTRPFTPAERAELGDRLAAAEIASNRPVCGGPINGGCVCQVPDPKAYDPSLTASEVAVLLAPADYTPMADPIHGGDVFARVAASEVA